MKVIKISTAVLTLLTATFSPTQSMEPTQENTIKNDVSWLPKHFTPAQKKEISDMIREEKPAFIVLTTPNANRHMGRNFTIDYAQIKCLETVRDLNEKANGKRPAVADIGAGFGYMTRKLILAGADVVAVEPEDPTRAELIKNVEKTIPYLNKSETIKQVYRYTKISALDFEKCPAYKNKSNHFDVTYSGNLLHLFTPPEATAYVKNLYKITKSGGYAFATAFAPCISPEMFRFYLQQKKAGSAFPGYIIADIIESGYRLYHTKDKGQQILKYSDDRTYYPVDTRSNHLSPTVRKTGFYTEKPDEQQTNIQGDAGQLYAEAPMYLDEHTGDYYQKANSHYHKAHHGFDAQSLNDLFKGAGFVVENVFYMDIQSGTRVENEQLFELTKPGNENRLWVGIKARKP